MNTIDNKQLGAVIKTARHRAGLSKRGLCRMLNIHRSARKGYERGQAIPTQLIIKLIQQAMQAYVHENKPKQPAGITRH